MRPSPQLPHAGTRDEAPPPPPADPTPPRAHTDRSSDTHAAPTRTDIPRRRAPRLATTAPSTQPHHKLTPLPTAGTTHTPRRSRRGCPKELRVLQTPTVCVPGSRT